MITNWTDAYNNRNHIPDAEGFIARWPGEAAAFRASLGDRARLDLPYGPQERRRFDLFLPAGDPRGLAVFVHGGYWMAFSKSEWSHLAAGALSRGWAVAMPSYTLAPQARIAGITEEIGRAVTAAAAEVTGPIRLAGHSAGGHLVSRMICEGGPLAAEIADRVESVLTISGVHDLRPLLATEMNDTLGIDAREAATESPALLTPRPGSRVTAWVGAAERPEFLRQTDLLAMAWSLTDITIAAHHDADRHHFDVIEGLEEAGSGLTEAWVGEG